MTVDIITFNGQKFRRYPDSPHQNLRRYYSPTHAGRLAGLGYLHQEVWKAHHNRPIPAGHHIHHVDFDHLNNDPSNLVCVTAAGHRALHRQGQVERGRTAESLAHLDRIREQTKAWHSTPEGREWHREHGRRVMDARPLLASFCDRCGQEFTSKRPDRFCSNRCKAAARRASGVDDEQRTCLVCSARFTVNRYSRTRTCSRPCGARLNRQETS